MSIWPACTLGSWIDLRTRSSRRPRTLSAGELLDWDSEFWGIRIGRACGPAADADDWARGNAVECLYLLVDARHVDESHAAQQAGFQLVDVRIELQRLAAAERAAVRGHHEDDVAALQAIARMSHGDTRFYADPRFPRERCDDLYDVWIRRSCEGWAQAVLVPDEKGPAAGYVSVHVDEAGQRGSIGLIAVAPDARGRGVGETLTRGAVDWCHRRGLLEILVVTQGRNVSAQRVFQRCGFRTSTVGLWFHKWYPTSQAVAAT